MLNHVLPPDVENKCHLRLNRRDVSEVLLGAHTKINAARFPTFLQPRNDVLELRFIRHVLEPERTAVFRKVRSHFPERVVTDLTRNSVGSSVRRNSKEKCRETDDACKAGGNSELAMNHVRTPVVRSRPKRRKGDNYFLPSSA